MDSLWDLHHSFTRSAGSPASSFLTACSMISFKFSLGRCWQVIWKSWLPLFAEWPKNAWALCSAWEQMGTWKGPLPQVQQHFEPWGRAFRAAAGLFLTGILAEGFFLAPVLSWKLRSKELGSSVAMSTLSGGNVATAKPFSPGFMMLCTNCPEGSSLTMHILALSKYCWYSCSDLATETTEALDLSGISSSSKESSPNAAFAFAAQFWHSALGQCLEGKASWK